MSHQSLHTRGIVTADEHSIHQSDTDTVVIGVSKSSGKSSDSEVHIKRLSSRLWSFLHGSKHVSSRASTVHLVEANTGIYRNKHVPDKCSNYSLFGLACTENEQNVDPQNSVVKDHQFGTPGDTPQSDCHQLDGSNIRGGRHPAGSPNGELLEGGLFQNGEPFEGGQTHKKTAMGESYRCSSVHGGFSHEKACYGEMVGGMRWLVAGTLREGCHMATTFVKKPIVHSSHNHNWSPDGQPCGKSGRQFQEIRRLCQLRQQQEVVMVHIVVP